MRLAGILFSALVVGVVAGCGSGGQSGSALSARRAPSPSASARHRPTPTATPSGVRTPSASPGGKASPAPGARRSPTPAPNQKVGPPAASQNLTFSGDLSGSMTALVTQSAQTPSACSERSVEAASWASTLYGTINGEVYGFLATVKPYNGPGTYTGAQAQVQLFSVTAQDKTWESLPGDSVTFTVHNDNLTGTVVATLHNLSSNQATQSVVGSWSCAP